MRAAFVSAKGEPLVIEDVEVLPPGPGDVVVSVGAAGVCHSDLSMSRGKFDIPQAILGHEGVGIITEVGSEVTSLSVGDRVISVAIPRCGACAQCLGGEPYLCRSGGVFGPPRARRGDGSELVCTNGLGTFAQVMTVSSHSLVKVETDLPDEQVALVGCALMTGVGAVLNEAQVAAGSDVLVVGLGGVGQAVVQGARVANAGRIIGVDPVAAKRDAALASGATHVLDPADATPEAIQELTGGAGVAYAFDAVGYAATIRSSYAAMRRGGRLVVLGIGDMTQDIALPGTLVADGKRVAGCVFGSADVEVDAGRILRLMESGALDAARLVTSTAPLEGVNDAFAALENGSALRTVLLP